MRERGPATHRVPEAEHGLNLLKPSSLVDMTDTGRERASVSPVRNSLSKLTESLSLAKL